MLFGNSTTAMHCLLKKQQLEMKRIPVKLMNVINEELPLSLWLIDQNIFWHFWQKRTNNMIAQINNTFRREANKRKKKITTKKFKIKANLYIYISESSMSQPNNNRHFHVMMQPTHSDAQPKNFMFSSLFLELDH